MVMPNSDRVTYHAELLRGDLMDLWWRILPNIGTMNQRRLLSEAFVTRATQRIGAAVQEALEAREQEVRALLQLADDGCPHAG